MLGTVRRVRLSAAALLFLAAGMHVVAAFEPEHLEKQLFFTFFWAVVFAQAVAGLAVYLKGGRWFTIGAILLNVLLISAFVVTRFVPVPGEDHPEPIEAFGLLTKAVEFAALPFLAWLAFQKPVPNVAPVPTEAL